MPVVYLSKLTSPRRTARRNLHLGVTLAAVAGALNAGGFLAVGQYTSHMSGVVSSAADHFALGQIGAGMAALLLLVFFVLGSSTTALLVGYARRIGAHNPYSRVLLLEAALLLLFGLIGKRLQTHEVIHTALTALLLCYTMGLQNALVTKISNAEVRTTHVTGLVTDLGIELGKLAYWNADPHAGKKIQANRAKLRLHLSLLGAFFCGGLSGALAFEHFGFAATLGLALPLAILALAPTPAPDAPAQ